MERQGTIISESAGTVLLGASILPADYLPDKRRVQPDSMAGLNLFPGGRSFYPHYTDKRSWLFQVAESQVAPSDLIPLKDGEAYVLRVDGTEGLISR